VTNAKKDTPGSGTSTDTSGKASTDRKSDRKDSGQKGAAEDKVRKQQIEEGLEKAAKHAEETGAAVPVIVSPVQDRPTFVGDEHRDETHDPGFEPPADGTLRQHEAFDFDYAFKGKQVDHIAVASTANVLVLEIDGTYYTFDAQLAGALRRLVQAGAVNLNL
jgi:hypothetical protein